MWRTNFNWKFLLATVSIYAICVCAWPLARGCYSACVREVGSLAFDHTLGNMELDFQVIQSESTERPVSRVEIANGRLLHPDGSGPVRNLDMDLWTGWWCPSSLLVALVLASPASRLRRLISLAAGLPILHIFICVALAASLWNEAGEISLVHLGGFWKSLAVDVEDSAPGILQLAAPVLVWFVVVIRKNDLIKLLAAALPERTLAPE